MRQYILFKKSALIATLIIAITCSAAISADSYERKEIDCQGPDGLRIKAVRYPRNKKPATILKQRKHKKLGKKKKLLMANSSQRLEMLTPLSPATPFVATMVESPPLDGFVPQVAISITDKNKPDLELDADTHTSVVGTDAASNPQTGYAIGIFDSGASTHVIGYENSILTGLYTSGGSQVSKYFTSNPVAISGVTGSVEAIVSEPLGVFIDGLGSINTNNLLLDRSQMVGESNFAIAIGDEPVGIPDLVTAIGSPMSVYFCTVINNSKQVSLVRNDTLYTSPDLVFYEPDDTSCPEYTTSIPLELRPLGATSVQYVPVSNPLDIFDFLPGSPSVIVGNLTQSLFFVHSVDIYEEDNSAIDKDRFMLDTGAQVTVIGNRIAARLGLNPDANEFIVEIVGVTGESIDAPGFYIDLLEIPALGEWLSFENVPVILLDIASPEGGTLDGIIGMNLFVDFNLVLRGGGLFLTDDPALEFEPIDFFKVADIAPQGGDGVVNYLDLQVLTEHWLTTPELANWDPSYDVAPHPVRDAIVNFLDYAMIVSYWQQTSGL